MDTKIIPASTTRTVSAQVSRQQSCGTVRDILRGLLTAVFTAVLLLTAGVSAARESAPDAIKGLTKKNGGAGCAACHGAVDSTMSVAISGPSYLAPGVAATYTVTTSKSAVADGTRLGVAIAASYGPALTTPLSIQPAQTNLVVDNITTNGEVIHSKPANGSLNTTAGGSASYQFTYTMPSAATLGSAHTLYATARMSCCSWNHADNFPVTAATVPSAPTIGTATRGIQQASISFSAPTSNGGLTLSYTATCSAAGETTRSNSGSASPLIVSPLTTNVGYTCSVTASNAAGTGPASTSLSSVMAATLPGAPTIGTATAGPQQASVNFTAPANTGGLPLTYAATCSASGQTTRSNTGSASPIVVSSLTAGVTYACSVAATNSLGTGPASSAASVSPTGLAVTFSGGPNGTLSPSGAVEVALNGSVPFSVQANAGYQATIGGTCPVNASSPPFSAGPITTSCTVTVTFAPVVAVGFTSAASSTQARAAHTATLLNNGEVLMAGGMSASSTYLTSAEKYQRSTNTWSTAGNLQTPRSGHTATLLADGRVLVVGGANASQSMLASVEIYDPASNSWSNAAPLPAARSRHSAVRLIDGTVLVAGGGQTTLARYNPVQNTWANAPVAAVSGSAVLLNSGQVLIVDTASAKLFDTDANILSNAGTMPTARADFAVGLLADGRVIATGGRVALNTSSAADIYNPVTNTWSAAAPMSVPRTTPLAILTNGQVLVVGGSNNSGILNSAEVYDPGTNSWSSAGNLTIARYDLTATRLGNGAVLVHGGRTLLDFFSSSELYIGAAATAPGAPRSVTSLAGNGQVTLSFDPPDSNGGAPIASYTATCSSLGRPDSVASASGSPIVVGGLVNFVGYNCSIFATNPAGNGPASAPVVVISVDPPTIIGPTTAMGTVSQTFYYQIFSSTVATSYAVSGTLPAGISLNTTSGVISGTPTQAGVFNLMLSATNGAGTGTAMLQITIAGQFIALVNVVSRKIHGSAGPFDIEINPATPIDGAIDVDPRASGAGGAGHVLLFKFDNNIIGLANITAQDAAMQDVGNITSAIVGGNTIEVGLTNIPDNQRIKVSINYVNSTTDVSASIGFFTGDVSNTRQVTAADISAVKANLGRTVNSNTLARLDLNGDGAITQADVNLAKSKAAKVLP